MFIADFHIHSKYSRATSKECVPEFLDLWARRKGLDLIGTGDFTHPAWRRELREKLVSTDDGLYRLKDEFTQPSVVANAKQSPRFIITGEISSIYKKNGKVRKVHNLILLPGLEEAEVLSHRLEAIGNLHSDGRPILGLDSKDLLEITLEACPTAIFIPAHIWTPHFSLFGAYSGFDTIEECFEDMTCHIHALETGLSSNPAMTWRLSALDRFILISNSDAHSPGNLAREANLFDTQMSYHHVAKALETPDSKEFCGTIEFYPEEGKYHFNGHRNCRVCQSPTDTIAAGGICPVCGRKVTLGVLHRIEELADRDEETTPPLVRGFESLVPLHEVIAASTGFSPTSIKGKALYQHLLAELGAELYILREAAHGDIEAVGGAAMAEGIRRLRSGEVEVSPGYDGEYGKVKILDPDEIRQLSGQMCLFTDTKLKAPRRQKSAGTKAETKTLVDPEEAEQHMLQYKALSGLNEKQQAAVFTTSPVTTVIAGPGTGKTKTLVARIAHLVQECGVSPAQITAVTFTNKAASEMRSRLIQHFGNKTAVEAMTIGTFHSICLNLLRQRGLRDISIVDEASCVAIMKDLIQEIGCKISVKNALKEISLRKCGVKTSEIPNLPEGLEEAYNTRLQEYGAVDYDDILLLALDNENLPDEMQDNKCFTYLLVDEFQDINQVQYRLIQQWGKNSQGIFVIGDPNQSIYGFRGSDARCFEWLHQDYPDLTQIILTDNYRSTPEILEVAAPVVTGDDAHNPVLLEAKNKSGVKVRLVNTDNPFSEALFVVKEINRMVGGIDMLDSHQSPLSAQIRGFSDIAILYRTNRQAAILEECLIQEGIPYVVSGREDFFSTAEVSNTLAFFRMLINPADMLSVSTCLKNFADYGQADAKTFLKRYKTAEKSLDVMISMLNENTHHNTDNLVDMIKRYRGIIRQESPKKLLASFGEEYLQENPSWLEMLLHMAVFHNTMEEFMRMVTLGQESDFCRYGGKQYSRYAVSLMTLHGAKGLEFPVVFLCGVTEGLIPHKGYDNNKSLGEEEQRLLYVGITRAKEELILLNSGVPSPFIENIPEKLLDIKTAKRQKQPYMQSSLFDL